MKDNENNGKSTEDNESAKDLTYRWTMISVILFLAIWLFPLVYFIIMQDPSGVVTAPGPLGEPFGKPLAG